MRVIVLAAALVFGLGIAHAGATKALKPYAGKLVISPDAPPSTLGELAGYFEINVAKDGHYELIKGAPWTAHLSSWLVKPAKTVTIVVVDKAADAKAAPLLSVSTATSAGGKLVNAQFDATIAAGFAANTTYEVRLLAGKKLLAKAELLLRD
jgi:hypothetical protein